MTKDMAALKEKLLYDTYKKFIDVSFGDHLSLNTLGELLVEDVMGFGTALDEKIFFESGVLELIKRQREQSKGLQMKVTNTPVFHRIANDGNSAVIADDISIALIVNNEASEIYVRYSVLFEFRQNKWLVVHFHVSKPENVKSETDTFGIEEWKQRNAELEKIVAERTLEITKQKEALEHALYELRSTQTQLIQSEKMASLGELTAGIAHEIQNPLNFVNNFAEVNTDLIGEMKQEIEKGDLEEIKAIATDIEENSKKITLHGKRAGSIVKGMLEHSGTRSGKREPTDINTMADEYMRLSYHGLRAKDKDFNAEMVTHFDPNLPKINVVQQDIGRVLLNLFNNAFYAVHQKAKTAGTDYKPEVSVTTSTENSNVIIKVKDNGVGIPDAIKDKIMQPFFTTKPTGEGTGLGLSLTYDMVVKGHGGSIQVNSIEGEGSEFIVTLPIN